MGSWYFLVSPAIFLWGLWFLHVPGGRRDRIGLKVKYILPVLVISFVPWLNLIAFILSLILVVILIAHEGWKNVFPGQTGVKLDKFFNYQFLNK